MTRSSLCALNRGRACSREIKSMDMNWADDSPDDTVTPYVKATNLLNTLKYATAISPIPCSGRSREDWRLPL